MRTSPPKRRRHKLKTTRWSMLRSNKQLFLDQGPISPWHNPSSFFYSTLPKVLMPSSFYASPFLDALVVSVPFSIVSSLHTMENF